MDNELLRFFLQNQDLVTEHRPIRLRLGHSKQLQDHILLPQQVSGTEAVCGGIEYRIQCVSLSTFIPLKDLIALPVAIDLVTDRGNLRSICGLVTEAHAGESDGGLASYQLVLRDALAIMEKRTNTRVFRNMSEIQIVQELLDEWRQANPIISACFQYKTDELFASVEYPSREFTMQYNESDAGFIRRLLKRRGIAWYFQAGHDAQIQHTMVLFNHPGSLPESAAGEVRYHQTVATEERDTINAWHAIRTLQPGQATRFSWNYKRPSTTGLMVARAQSAADQGRDGNQLSATLDDYQIWPPHVCENYDDLLELGQLAIQRHDYESKCFIGEGSVRDLCAGEYFTLDGHPEIDRHAKNEREFVVTSLHLTASNNLPANLTKRVESMFARNHWLQNSTPATEATEKTGRRVNVQLMAVRRGIRIVPAYDARTELPSVPMQTAVVVGLSGEEVYCDELGRVKIRFRYTREEDHKHAQGAGASDCENDSAWVRVASNWAGSGPGNVHQCGNLSLPRVGSEVLVAFLGNDPDKPIIVAQLYNDLAKPPALGAEGGLPGNRYRSGIRSQEINGLRGNQLVLDDTTAQISAQLASDHGDSQLNLGFLTKSRIEGFAEPRGAGAELRTCDSIALRGSKGILLTTEDDGEQTLLDRSRLHGLIDGLRGISDLLVSAAKTHNQDTNDTEKLHELISLLTKWNEDGGNGKKLVAVAADDGTIVASARSTLIGAQEEVSITSGGNSSHSSGASIFVRALREISLFAHKLGLKLIAANGNVSIQAHQGDIELSTPGTIRISAGTSIEIMAPMVKIATEGAQADFGAGTIIHQCSGEYAVKSAKFLHTTGGDGAVDETQFPSTKIETDERVILYHSQSGKPVTGRRYSLDLPDGRTITGTTDSLGQTELAVSDVIGEVQVTIFPAHE